MMLGRQERREPLMSSNTTCVENHQLNVECPAPHDYRAMQDVWNDRREDTE